MPAEIQAGQDAPVVDNTATPPVTAPATTETPPSGTQNEGQDENEPAVERTYTEAEFQERIERATAKAAAKAERRAYREALGTLARQPQEQRQEQTTEPAPRNEGESDAAYVRRLVNAELEQRDNQTRQQKTQERLQSLNARTEILYSEAEKIPGFDRDDFESLPLTSAIAETITESDVAPKLMAYLATNPQEVDRIAKLSPARQAAEIGKLETKVSTAKPPSVSKAPEPITPLGSKGGIVKSLATASVDDVAAMMKKNGSRWVR